MKDGLYQVHWKRVTAGFVMEGGMIVTAAPIVWAHPWLLTRAVWICA